MGNEVHRQRHVDLHEALDELIADYIVCTGQSLTRSSILDLMNWSSSQTVLATEPDPKIRTFDPTKGLP